VDTRGGGQTLYAPRLRGPMWQWRSHSPHPGSLLRRLAVAHGSVDLPTAQVYDAYPLDKVPESPLQPRDLRIALNVNLITLMGVHWSLYLSRLLSSFDLLVQTDQNLPEPETSSDSYSKHSDNDSVRLSETIFGHLPDVRSSDVSELREGVDHGDCDSSLCGRSGEGRTQPTVEYDETCVGAGLEEECDVSGGDDLCADADHKPYETKADRANNVPELNVRTCTHWPGK
jgi:hypothetical protein